MGSEPSTRYRRILISRMKFIGDVVLTTPAIRSVRMSCPGATIVYLGEKEAVSLLRLNPCLDEIIPFDFARPTLLEQTRVIRELRRRRFDLAIDLFGNPRSTLLCFASGAPVRVGPARKGRGRLFTIRVSDDGLPKTAIEFHHQSLRAAGIEPASWKTELFLSDEERQAAAELLRGAVPGGVDAGAPLVGIHAGATWPAKRWPAERFAALADLLAQELGARVLLTVGPKDAETVNAVRASATSAPAVLPVLPVRSLAAVLSWCSAFVSNDAGPMHIAAALDVPTIGIFGPGEENIWFPYDPSTGHRALRKDVPCHPCHLDFCNRPGEGYMECMNLLFPREVLSAVASALQLRR